jgi:hypothetical protein
MHQRVTWGRGGGGKEANSMISCNLGNVGRMVNLVVKVDVKENMGE